MLGLCLGACAMDVGDESSDVGDESSDVGAIDESADVTAASSSYTYLRHPTDPSYGRVRNHYWITACDRQVDGHRVRVQYDYVWAPTTYSYTHWAPSGGCTPEIGTLSAPRTARVCVEGEGCGKWVSTP